jgi:hypothetical protein
MFIPSKPFSFNTLTKITNVDFIDLILIQDYVFKYEVHLMTM